jgi:hypothetical protein
VPRRLPANIYRGARASVDKLYELKRVELIKPVAHLNFYENNSQLKIYTNQRVM